MAKITIIEDNQLHTTLVNGKHVTQFSIDEYTDPYKLAENFNGVLNRLGFKLIRVVKTGKGSYDTPYYFVVKPDNG